MDPETYDSFLDRLLAQFFPDDNDDTFDVETITFDNKRYFRTSPKVAYLYKHYIGPTEYYIYLVDINGDTINNLPSFADLSTIKIIP